jgi:hypothetical protein
VAISPHDELQAQTEILAGQRDENLSKLLMTRQVSDAEAKMLADREKQYNLRKILEKVLYMLPSIVYALGTAIERLISRS